MVSWIKLEKEDLEGNFEGYDLVVRSTLVYIPKNSKLREMLKKSNYKFDLYIDYGNGRIAVVPNSKGEFSMPQYFMLKNGKKLKKVEVDMFRAVLGLGYFIGQKEGVEGKEALVFRRRGVKNGMGESRET